MSESSSEIIRNQKEEHWAVQYYRWCVKEDGYTDFFQIVTSFALGLIFSAFTYGFLYFLIFYIIWEIFLLWRLRIVPTTEYMITRFGILCAGILGFIIGRWLEYDNDPIRHPY